MCRHSAPVQRPGREFSITWTVQVSRLTSYSQSLVLVATCSTSSIPARTVCRHSAPVQRPGRELNPRVAVLQTAALPLRHQAFYDILPRKRITTKCDINNMRRGDGMVDIRDLKSRDLKVVRVRVPPPAHKYKRTRRNCAGFFCICVPGARKLVL